MARKKKPEEHENHERWLVSYADFITLLFAFFTSMYAISSVNEGKFRVLSESLAIAFNPSLHTAARISDGPRFVKDRRAQVKDDFQQWMSENYRKVLTALKELDKNKRLSLIVEDKRIVIRISESMLFKPASDEFMEEGKPVIDEIAGILEGLPNGIKIEGHTDDVPIKTPDFPTNWDLSSARALKILKYFIYNHDYDPKKLSAVGYGQYRPITSNNTPSGRAKNRRVDITVVNIDRTFLD